MKKSDSFTHYLFSLYTTLNPNSLEAEIIFLDFTTLFCVLKFLESNIMMSRNGGYKGYAVESTEDLTKPFVSMYFGAAYTAWLSQYEGR